MRKTLLRRQWTGWYLVAGGYLLLLVALAIAGDPGASFAVVAGLVLGAALVRLLPADRPFALRLYLAAFGTRLLAGLAVVSLASLAGAPRLVFPDAMAYHVVARDLAAFWWEVGSGPDPESVYLLNPFSRLVAGLYWLVGPTALGGIYLNAALAAGTSVLIGDLGRRLYNPTVGRLAGILAAFLPSTFFWSVLLLKDTALLFASVVIVWLVFEFLRTRAVWPLLVLVPAWLVLRDLRDFAALLLALLTPIALVLNWSWLRRRWIPATALLLAMLTLLLTLGGYGLRVQEWAALDVAHIFESTRALNAVDAESAYVEPPRPITIAEEASRPPAIVRIVAYLPKGLAYALGAPFPWDTPKAAQKATIPDMLLWYVCLALAAIGLWLGRARWRELFLPLSYVGCTILVLALTEGNVGTVYRHRMMIIPFVTLFSAAGLQVVWERYAAGARRPALLQRAAQMLPRESPPGAGR